MYCDKVSLVIGRVESVAGRDTAVFWQILASLAPMAATCGRKVPVGHGHSEQCTVVPELLQI